MTTPLDPDTLFAGLVSPSGLLLAVSGGPDSIALLLLIDRWRKSRDVPVSVATVDHRFRAESAEEAAGVAAFCAARDLPHHTLVWDGDKPRTRIQEIARNARYDLLVRHAKAICADTIVTAHHADDQAETILMRLTRGSGPSGLAGMADCTRRDGIAIARPLLTLHKSDLIALCRAEGAAFVDDPSNHDEVFRRTSLRRLAPLLAAEGLDAEALRRLGRRAARADQALQWAQTKARDVLAIVTTDTSAEFPAKALAALPTEIAIRLVAGEVARLSSAGVRLEKLEALALGLRDSILREEAFTSTLGSCLIRFRHGKVTIAPAPARRNTHQGNDSCDADAHRYLSSPTLLGNAGSDA